MSMSIIKKFFQFAIINFGKMLQQIVINEPVEIIRIADKYHPGLAFLQFVIVAFHYTVTIVGIYFDFIRPWFYEGGTYGQNLLKYREAAIKGNRYKFDFYWEMLLKNNADDKPNAFERITCWLQDFLLIYRMPPGSENSEEACKKRIAESKKIIIPSKLWKIFPGFIFYATTYLVMLTVKCAIKESVSTNVEVVINKK